MDSFARGISGEQGKSRTFEENKLLILALRGYLRMKVENGDTVINWNAIEREVARGFFVCHNHIHDLRMGFLEDGVVWVFGSDHRGGAADGAKLSKNVKVTTEMLKSVAQLVDTMHSTGKVVVSKMVVAHIIDRFGTKIHRVTAGKVMKRRGLK